MGLRREVARSLDDRSFLNHHARGNRPSLAVRLLSGLRSLRLSLCDKIARRACEKKHVARFGIGLESEVLCEVGRSGHLSVFAADIDEVLEVGYARCEVRARSDLDAPCEQCETVARVDAALDGDHGLGIDRHAVTRAEVLEKGVIEGGRLVTVGEVRPRFELILRRDRRREAAGVDDARRSHQHADRGDEIEVAADLIVLHGVHDAVNLDLCIDEVEELLAATELQICNLIRIHRELFELVDAGLAAVDELGGRDVEDLARLVHLHGGAAPIAHDARGRDTPGSQSRKEERRKALLDR